MIRTRVVWLCVGLLLGALWSSPVSAQVAVRLFATLSGDLTTGTSTPVLCTASGSGCTLQVNVR
jgi:hypothetical protein